MAAIAPVDTGPPSAVGVPPVPRGWPRRFPGKRLLDVVVASVLLLLCAPLFVAVAVAVRLGDGGPVLYRQQRVGRGGSRFRILKFRTMVVDADASLESLRAHNVRDGLLFKMPDDPRVTRVGRWLRASSLDEIPQLWNVLRGEMSLVGPRPIAAEPRDFTPAESQRHTTRPGITGCWQLSGGSFAEMIRLDLAYIASWSLWLDVRLILRTVPTVLVGLTRAGGELR